MTWAASIDHIVKKLLPASGIYIYIGIGIGTGVAQPSMMQVDGRFPDIADVAALHSFA
jgi:hypothetical protein